MQALPRSGLSTFLNSRLALCALLIPLTWLSVVAASRYPGSPLVFATFAVLCNLLLLSGFRRGASFFDSFIGLFFWLGFFLKLSVRVAFFDGKFSESVGAFDGSGAAFDLALTVCSVAFAALLAGSLIRQRFFVYPDQVPDCADSGLYHFYCAHRRTLLVAFVGLVLAISISNVWLGIYQRGMVAQTILPLGLNGVYKWLLQFGLTSISALAIRFEIARKNTVTNTAIFVPLLENFLCNVSLLSRGMILNGAALLVGTWRQLERGYNRIRTVHLLLASLSFAILFAASVFAVNFLRSDARLEGVGKSQRTEMAVENAAYMSKILFIDRWVGMEGVLAVTASKDLGRALLQEALQEKYVERSLSLFDRRFIDSPYKDMASQERFHFVSLPGLVAFLYYSGSLWFVFFATLALGILAAGLEIACYRWCGRNLILCSLFAQVIAFRYASFGYVPSQSYLLFGTLIMNGMIIAGADYLLSRRYARQAGTVPV